jgi:hypothetical protein
MTALSFSDGTNSCCGEVSSRMSIFLFNSLDQ